MALPIIGADERLAQRKGIKGVHLRPVRHRQDQPALDAERLDHALPRSRGRGSGGRGAGDRHAPAPHLEGMPRLRGVHRRAEPGAARGPALQPGAFRRGLRALRRSGGDREVRDRLHRLDHRGRAALLPVVPGPARGVLGEDRQARHPRRLRAAWPRDDRLADPPAAHARQACLVRRASSTSGSTTSIARSSSRRSTARRPGSSCRGSSIRSSPWPTSPDARRPAAARLRLPDAEPLGLSGQGSLRPPRQGRGPASRPADGEDPAPRGACLRTPDLAAGDARPIPPPRRSPAMAERISPCPVSRSGRRDGFSHLTPLRVPSSN